jgi:hypothetical protein
MIHYVFILNVRFLCPKFIFKILSPFMENFLALQEKFRIALSY